jgi:type I restriction enzyme M protein
MVALPGQLFYSTQIPVCLWFIKKSKQRKGSVLFIDARKMGSMTSRVHRELMEDDIARIVGTYRAWQNDESYQDIPGFCASATIADIAKHDYVLTPGRYVGAEEVEDDGEPFDAKMKRFTTQLAEQFAESARLEHEIRNNLKGLGYEW